MMQSFAQGEDGMGASMRFAYNALEALCIEHTGMVPAELMTPEELDSIGKACVPVIISISATHEPIQPGFTREMKRAIMDAVYDNFRMIVNAKEIGNSDSEE